MFKLDSPIMNFLNRLFDLVILNIIAVICCIPVITAGASITAVYYVAFKMVKNEEGYIVRSFFKAFKDNFKQSTAIWLIQLLIIFVLIMDYRIITLSGITFNKALIIAIMAGAIIFLLGMQFAFPLQARFVNPVKNTVKNSFLMCFSHLPTVLLMVVITVIPTVIMYLAPIATPVIIFMGLSVVVYLQSFLVLRVFRPYEEAAEAKRLEEEATNAPEEEDTGCPGNAEELKDSEEDK